MADDVLDNDDEFISLDDDDIVEEPASDSHDTEGEVSSEDTPAANNKLLYILIAVFTVLAFAMLGFLLYLYLSKKTVAPDVQKTDEIINTIKNKKSEIIQAQSYQKLVNEAKKLYHDGKKEEALARYHDISLYNKALTFYNIGVAQLKEKHYDKALEAFTRSSKNEKLKLESLLNMAVAAFGKEDARQFQDYLNRATKALPDKMGSPLYSYYRALIDYYRGFYAEALVPLRHQSSDAYHIQKNRLMAKLYAAFDNYTQAIKVTEKNDLPEDFFTLGLLYANQHEYTLSEKYLQKAIEINKSPLNEKMALSLVYNKMGLFKKSSALLNSSYQKYKEKAQNSYPIAVSLKEALFDPVAAQKDFQKNLFFNDRNTFSLLFYFAPYRLMNPKQTINNIHQGAKNIYINALGSALDNLHLSGTISDANLEITKGIKAALTDNLYTAQKIFKEGIKRYPNSAQLHYNLALTDAKLYQFKDAYVHFKKSSVLDTTYYLSPIFAYLCGSLLHKEPHKETLTQIENKINNSDSADKAALLSLIAITRKDIQGGDLSMHQTPFEDVLVIILSQIRQDAALYRQSTTALLKKIPDDLITNILHIDATQDKRDIKAYAKVIQATLTKPMLNFTPLSAGNAFVKEYYIQMLNIAGIVPQAKIMLEKKLQEKGTESIALLQALAYTDIFTQEFDQAYAIYNHLIDKKNQQDSNTLFLAAIASIGSAHHANAIALLELAKLTNESNLESRFALGILYHEIKNIEGAAIQYEKIGDGGFHSRYFTFNIEHLK